MISFDFEERNNKNKFKALFLMTISSFLFATYFILFDIGIRNGSYNSCAFWYQIGLLLLGVFLVCIKSFRIDFIKKINKNGKKYFLLNITNESINLTGNLLMNFANIAIPISVVNVLNGFQGAFVFIISAVGIKIFPKYFKENLNMKLVIQKISCILLSITGLIVMFIN